MAKKKGKFTFSELGNILDDIAKVVPFTVETDVVTEKEFISTGIYILDAAISGSIINGGIQANRITAVAGESGVGKSFVAYGIVREAQKKGYSVVYVDTEHAIELSDLINHKIDIAPNLFKLIRSNKVEDMSIILTKLVNQMKQSKVAGDEMDKIMFVIDSVGMMASNKELTDLVDGKLKQDMTRAKALAQLFRTISADLGYLKIPMVVTNHTYLTQDMFPQEVMKGGNGLKYSASTIISLSKAKLKTGAEDDMDLGASGIIVTAKCIKNRLAKPKKVKFEINFETGSNPYVGLDAFCRPEYFDKIGIAKGKMELDKSTGELAFRPGGNKFYVKHLDKSFFMSQLFNKRVFSDQVLMAMEPFINDYFKFKSRAEEEEAEKMFNEQDANFDDDLGGKDAEDISAADLFDL
jgi:RecA/RadA recombinase